MANEYLVKGWRKPKGRYVLDLEFRVDFDWGDGMERRIYDFSFVIPQAANTLAKLKSAVNAEYDTFKATVAVVPEPPTAKETALNSLVGNEYNR